MGGLCPGGNKRVKVKYRIFEVNDQIPGQGQKAIATFERLALPGSDVQKFFQTFLKIDRDDSGSIDIEEFFAHFRLDQTAFGKRVFSIMDKDSSGSIDFTEFVVSIWNYCTFDNAKLVTFAFDLYDLDSGGALEFNEVQHLVSEVYGVNSGGALNSRVLKIMDKLDADDSGHVSLKEFVQFNRKYPAILFPAFQMQQILRRATFGERHWEIISRKRADVSGHSDIFDILASIEEAIKNLGHRAHDLITLS